MNEELRCLYEEDQADRQSIGDGTSPEKWKYVSQRDEARLTRVKELLAAGSLHDVEDYFHAAMLHHHTGDLDNLWQAHELSLRAAELGHRTGRWLSAAAYDRWLLMQNKPQKYGTQYQVSGELFPVDPATSDAERAAWGVPPLEPLQAHARRRRD